MTDRPKFFDDLAGVAGGAFSALTGLRDEAQASARSAMEEAIRKLDLVRRSDLDAVQALAANARAGQQAAEARLAALEARVAALEGAASPAPHVPATSHPDVEESGAAQPPPREPLEE
jgi:BMFP domain-containing protein YqiC